MQDIEALAEKLNSQNPLDIGSLTQIFDRVYYKEPEGSDPVEAKHVNGFTISSPENAKELVQKLRKAKEANPKFIQIGDREYIFDSKTSLSRLIDGIMIGTESEHER